VNKTFYISKQGEKRKTVYFIGKEDGSIEISMKNCDSFDLHPDFIRELIRSMGKFIGDEIYLRKPSVSVQRFNQAMKELGY
jgi:hypothetical protein